MTLPELILASNSPRRRQLMALTGWNFTVSACEIDETPLPDEAPALYVSRLANGKAQARASQLSTHSLVVAADTIVADGDELLGKPAGASGAREMLIRLRGRTHQVYTALAVIDTASGKTAHDRCRADVAMRAYTDAEIEAYIASGDPLDKAGAYAIQHAGFHPVDNFKGCYACVMGLPLCHLTRTLAGLGIPAPRNVAAACQANLEYDCPVFASILRGEDHN
jgi:septum formation protein